MKYYYVNAAGESAGPEPLESLVALVAQGTVSLGTMVVPAGGADWVSLAKVMRFYYQDAAGSAQGAVAFSEINRLQQVGMLQAESWVLEEGGAEWKALSSVLAAAGVSVAAPAPATTPVRPATGAFRPPAAGKTAAVRTTAAAAGSDPYAAPKSAVAGTRVVRRPALGGMGRLPFFGLYLLTFLIIFIIIFLQFRSALLEFAFEPSRLTELIMESVIVMYVCSGIYILSTGVLTILRLKNVGWPVALVALHLIPSLSIFLPEKLQDNAGVDLALFLMNIVSLFIFILLLILPPGFARHRRFDTAAKVNTGIIVLLIGGLIALAFLKKPEPPPLPDGLPKPPAAASGS
jgi:hypothetical protein